MNTSSTIAELVNDMPAAARVLYRHGIDFCCGGKSTIDEACAASGVDWATLLDEIKGEQTNAEEDARWEDRPIDEIVEHIVRKYHEPLRKELPRLIELSGKIERVHIDKPDRPHGLKAHLMQMLEDLEIHMIKEEKILFPLVRSSRFSLAQMPVKVLMIDHRDVGDALRRVRELTNHLKIPEYACASWRDLYRSLEQLEFDLYQHIHLENNVLFPRILTTDL